MSQRVTVFGPNLSHAGQKIATFHVHAAGCAHCRLYGPGRKYGGECYGGEDGDEYSFEAANLDEIVFDVYPPEDFQYDPATEFDRFAGDFYIAPCVTLLWEAV